MAYNATSTYLTFLMHSTDGTAWEKLVDIKEFPDLGQDPELLDTTTLSDKQRTGVPGIIGTEAMSFTANYDIDDYKKCVQQMAADRSANSWYAVWFGGTENAGADPTPTGNLGKFQFKGKMVVRIAGGGVDEVRDMTLTITPATPIDLVEATGE